MADEVTADEQLDDLQKVNWKQLSSLPVPTVNDSSLCIYRLKLTEAKRVGNLSEKKHRNSNGKIPEDFNWDDFTVPKGISKSVQGDNTLFHYASSYCSPSKSQTKKRREGFARPRSMTMPIRSLQLMEINSSTRNPSQKQHRAVKSERPSFQTYHTRLKDLRKSNMKVLESLHSKTNRPLADVPRPPPLPLLFHRSSLVKTKPATLYQRLQT